MDDSTNVIDPSFMAHSSDEAEEDVGDNPGEGSHSTGTGLDDPPAQALPQHDRTPSLDQDFQSQDHVVLRPVLALGQANISDPRPSNVETEVDSRENDALSIVESWLGKLPVISHRRFSLTHPYAIIGIHMLDML